MQRALAWMQVLSAVGVLIGIVLVILQLQQNENLLRLQLATELRINRDADRNVIRGETYSETLAKLSGDPQKLTDAELHQFQAHAVSIYEELHLRRMLFDEGVFEGDWREWLTEERCLLFDNATGRAWLAWALSDSADEILLEIQRRLDECGEGFVESVRKAR
jgi:hypothetical protein